MRSPPARWPGLASVVALLATAQAVQPPTPANVGDHTGTAADHAAIEQLLESYTTSVAVRDERRFESLLLQPDIPFSSTRGVQQSTDTTGRINTQNFGSFKAAIFESRHRFRQTFFHVKIEQVGPLAQVSLDYSTTDDSTGQTSYGWKSLQLLKVNGDWKIASEFFTGYPPMTP